jgi:homogentisate 1,2-dioxygenase
MTYRESWTREGFSGDAVLVRRPSSGAEYLRVEGAHVPRRLNVGDVPISADAGSEPSVVLATTNTGVRLSLVRRDTSTPALLRNVDCDEVHFIQQGEARFRTSLGTLTAAAGDFICIPRAVTYHIGVPAGPVLSLVVESPTALRLATERPDLLDLERDVQRAEFEASAERRGEVLLVLKAGGEETRYLLPHDPLAASERISERISGVAPVWKVSLAKIQPAPDSSPVPFAETDGNDLLLYTLSARNGRRRPPVHVNADYDEIIHYFCGPGAWGSIDRPGTLTCVPRGVAHHGPSEDVPAGFLAWLLETRATLRWSPAAIAVAELMETESYGPHPSARPIGAM